MRGRLNVPGLLCLGCCVCGLFTANPEESSWRRISVGAASGSPLYGLTFANDQVGWLCSGKNTIWKTTDAGNTWTTLKTDLYADTNLSRVWFLDSNLGWTVGRAGELAAIWKSSNGGSNWVLSKSWPQVTANSIGALIDVRFADTRHGWAVGSDGARALIIGTSDGGAHWNTEYSGSEIDSQFKVVRFTDSQNGWALSPMSVMQTEDGGESWKLRHFDSGLLMDLAAVGPSEAWIAGAWGSLQYASGHVGWDEVRLSGLDDKFIGYIAFRDKKRGWADSSDGIILTTEDGGKTWHQELLPPGLVGKDISTSEIVATGSKVFVVANPGALLVRTIN